MRKSNYILDFINEVEEISFPYLQSVDSEVHGIKHLRTVAYLSARFAYSFNLEIKPIILAGYLHDCARNNDDSGNIHAHQSAHLAKDIIEHNWPNLYREKIYETIFFHADGLTTNDLFTGCIWDADRISLIRLGIVPRIDMLSTELVKRFHSIIFERNKLFNFISRISNKIYNEYKKFGNAIIGIWFTESSVIILRLILNFLETTYQIDFAKIFVLSLYEFENIPRYHDQSCCYQIYKSISHRIPLAQIFCPQHVSLKDIGNWANFQCVIVHEYQYPRLNFPSVKKGITKLPIDLEIRNYLARYYEKFSKTPSYIVTFSANVYENKIDTILEMNSKISVMKFTNFTSTFRRNFIEYNYFNYKILFSEK